VDDLISQEDHLEVEDQMEEASHPLEALVAFHQVHVEAPSQAFQVAAGPFLAFHLHHLAEESLVQKEVRNPYAPLHAWISSNLALSLHQTFLLPPIPSC